MDVPRSHLWRDVVGKLDALEHEVVRVEELVHGGLPAEPAPARAAGPRQHWSPLGAEPPRITVETAPRVVARLRRALNADPLRALDLSYPPGLFAPAVPADRVQRECLRRHATNTARLAMYVALRHGYEPSTVEAVGLCALLHDLWMERTPPELFTKAAPLTGDELRALQAHTTEGAELLRAERGLDGLLRAVASAVVRQHHERMDGSGYPDGLDEPHIHHFARLLALAEAYEAMVTPRPYRAPRLPYEAMETLLLEAFGKAGRAERFDRRLAAAFVRALSLYPIGSGVRLDTGETGQVVGANADDPARPHVRVLYGPDGRTLRRPRVIDLRHARIAVRCAVALPPRGRAVGGPG